jgi:hypothetical protein
MHLGIGGFATTIRDNQLWSPLGMMVRDALPPLGTLRSLDGQGKGASGQVREALPGSTPAPGQVTPRGQATAEGHLRLWSGVVLRIPIMVRSGRRRPRPDVSEELAPADLARGMSNQGVVLPSGFVVGPGALFVIRHHRRESRCREGVAGPSSRPPGPPPPSSGSTTPATSNCRPGSWASPPPEPPHRQHPGLVTRVTAHQLRGSDRHTPLHPHLRYFTHAQPEHQLSNAGHRHVGDREELGSVHRRADSRSASCRNR